MKNFSIKQLNMETWKDFEQLVQKHNGIWGGCWCKYFHPRSPIKIESQEAARSYKMSLVKEDRSHAALVYDGDICVGWCQYGPPEELPNIMHKKEVESRMTTPDWRITCIFIDRDYRKNGLSFVASVLTMDPSEFFLLILPLATLVTILVAVVLYLGRKEDTIQNKELETLHELMRTGEIDKENFSMALQDLVSKKVIDKDSCERLKKLLEKSL